MKAFGAMLLFLIANTWAPLGAAEEDPHLPLEQIESPAALQWVRAHNERSLAALKSDKRWATFEGEVRKIALATDRIPQPALRNGFVYNFWQDATHVKGLWRRQSLDAYAAGKPEWETLLDLDLLAKQEKENWVWKSSDCLAPEYTRCLLTLSRGGKDASVIREFDIKNKSFVEGGFSLPEAKSQMAWKDLDTVIVGTDFGPGSLTTSGYPRVLKLWKRGTPLAKAQTVLEGEKTDVDVMAGTSIRPEGNVTFLVRAKTFFTAEVFVLGPDGKPVRVPFPEDADLKGFFQGHLLAVLRSDWKTSTAVLPTGALVSLPVARIHDSAPDAAVEVAYAPDSRSALSSISTSRSSVFVATLENVRGRILRLERAERGWKTEKISLPDNGAVSLVTSDDFDDRLIVGYESFLVPSTLYLAEKGKELRALRQLPARFDASGLTVEQFEAKSLDGTRVPYFVVHRKGMKLDGSNPTLLYAYGGFEIAETPHYLSATGKVWLERGGVYALANIRGGGEFGPAWHKAALQKNRQRAYDDFAAVSKDLVARKVTSPRRLGIQGGSNGGLLMGVAFTQHPELYNAVLCEVPLLDMLRYHKLLAGASWMAEYGDPEDPAMREVLLKYSPYQNVKAGARYPKVFFMTSTKDDRVHPGHARKTAAKMESMGYDILYYENIEGGHGAAANLEQKIVKATLEFTYLFQQLVD